MRCTANGPGATHQNPDIARRAALGISSVQLPMNPEPGRSPATLDISGNNIRKSDIALFPFEDVQ